LSKTSASDAQKTLVRVPLSCARRFQRSGFFQLSTEVRCRGAPTPQWMTRAFTPLTMGASV
jgi:hypothetical protein